MSSGELKVERVDSGKDRKAFLELPWKLHASNPNWVPPLRMNQKELVGYKKHPFHQDAEVVTFLAKRNGEACGRIAAIIDRAHNRHHQESRGFFGFFESENDIEVSSKLFGTIKNWLANQGMDTLRGPVNPSMNYECGLLVEGFDQKPKFMMTYNPEYYPKLVENAGLTKSQDLLAFWGHIDMLDKLDKKLHFITEEAKKRFRVEVRRIDKKNFKQEVQTFLDIYNKSMLNNWGFVPLSNAELDHFAKSLRQLIVPELTSFAEVDGRPVAVVFGLLDYNPRIKEIDGKLFPTGFLKLLTNRRGIKHIRVIAANVIPEYQRWGLGLVVLHRLIPDVKAWGIEECEFSWVLESNKLSRGSLERGGAKKSKLYRLYDCDLQR